LGEKKIWSEIIWSLGRRRIKRRVNLVMQKDTSFFKYPSKLWSAVTKVKGRRCETSGINRVKEGKHMKSDNNFSCYLGL